MNTAPTAASNPSTDRSAAPTASESEPAPSATTSQPPRLSSAGLHHVTAIASSPQRTLDFHRQVLGLRLVKLTVNFDDPSTYHFYFGDRTGRPGSILTYFPWEGVGFGARGSGEASCATYAVGPGSLGFWERRLKAHGVEYERHKKFGADVLLMTAAPGAVIELCEDSGPMFEPLGTREIPVEKAIRGFHSVTLRSRDANATAEVLKELLGYRLVAQDGAVSRFGSEGTGLIDLIASSPGEPRARLGVGSIHHIAFRCGAAEQLAFREQVMRQGLAVTPPQERKYFRSLYFREPGGVLFEIATDEPGFTVDEELADLGRKVQLPEWLEPRRDMLLSVLPKLQLT